jgi:hypothetical protein
LQKKINLLSNLINQQTCSLGVCRPVRFREWVLKLRNYYYGNKN